MEMFLMVLAMSVIGIAVSAGLFAAATRQSATSEEAAGSRPVMIAPRFFGRVEAAAPRRVPIEALLLEIERHVRLENAAAESFVQSPTVDSLHSATVSTLVH